MRNFRTTGMKVNALSNQCLCLIVFQSIHPFLSLLFSFTALSLSLPFKFLLLSLCSSLSFLFLSQCILISALSTHFSFSLIVFTIAALLCSSLSFLFQSYCHILLLIALLFIFRHSSKFFKPVWSCRCRPSPSTRQQKSRKFSPTYASNKSTFEQRQSTKIFWRPSTLQGSPFSLNWLIFSLHILHFSF